MSKSPRSPKFKLPFKLPKLALPKIDLSKIKLPKIKLPKVDLSKIKLPKIDVSKVKLPKLPPFKLTDFHKEILRLSGILVAVCVVCAGLLGWVNAMTRGQIRLMEQTRTYDALAQVMPEADRFEDLPLVALSSGVAIDPPMIEAAWSAYAGDTPLGLCFQVCPQGYSGEITLLVGVDTQLAVTGVRVVSQRETAGLGTKAAEPAWLAQFEGLTGPLRLVGTIKSAEQDIVAVTSATVTSTAITEGVQAALDFAAYQAGMPIPWGGD